MTTKKKPSLQETVQQLMDQLQKSEAEKGALANLLAKQGVQASPSGQMMVGIRNVSSTTVGIVGSPLAGEGEIQLHATFGGEHDPNSVAAISWTWWQQLRKGKLVGKGFIVRDDSILGSSHVQAPEDIENELAKGHDVNTIRDPHEFITGQSETQFREAVKKITSEESLRRLLSACDEKVRELRNNYDENDPNREENAVSDLPGPYQIAELVVQSRLDQIGPVRAY